MISEPWLLGLAGTLLALGGYSVGVYHAERATSAPVAVWRGLRARLTLRGFFWATLPSVLGVAFFYALVLQVRFSQGGWPEFGAQLTGVSSLLGHVVWAFIALSIGAAYAVPALCLIGLVHPRTRPWSVYGLAFGAALFLAWGLAALAPGPFLNWFLD
jgi:hypothetical protein